MDPQAINDLFTPESLLSLQGSAIAALFSANVFGYLIANLSDAGKKWIAFIVSLVLSYLVAYLATDQNIVKWILAFFNGLVVFAAAMGGNQWLNAISGPGPAAGPGQKRFFDSWL